MGAEVYVKLPDPDELCSHCNWLTEAFQEAVHERLQTVQVLARQAMVVHLIQVHDQGKQALLPW